jgi:hypothetical protein
LALNWVCFGCIRGGKIAITAYCRIGCVHFGFFEIGFVLHKSKAKIKEQN